jgi:TPR repeat protein
MLHLRFMFSYGPAMARVKSRFILLVGAALVCLMLLGTFVVFSLNRGASGSSVSKASAALPDFQATKTKAEAGDGQAAELLAEIYAEGKQVRLDYKEAAKWYRKAADAGIAKAEYNLGVLYDIGQGVAQDEAEAAKWYLKAAEQGNSDAQYTLAGMYGLGRGVTANPKEALKWYHRAAEAGDSLARYNLAERYERGRDVQPDVVEAYKWHSLAADTGLQDAIDARQNLQKRMTAEQLAAARKRIEEFKGKFPGKK